MPMTESENAPKTDAVRIREYWDSRAIESGTAPAATTQDIHLRSLEIKTIIAALEKLGLRTGQTVLDVGCGNGYSTFAIARALPDARFIGIDYSAPMIEFANARLQEAHAGVSNLEFRHGDVMRLKATATNGPCDFVISDRCLVNLPTAEAQAEAIDRIAQCTAPGGYYIAVENFIEGHNAMNAARAVVDLPSIDLQWFNLHFEQQRFLDACGQWFDLVEFDDFASGYIYATRVVYSKMCQRAGVEPDYDHEIHRLAVDAPSTGEYAATKIAVLRRRDDQMKDRTMTAVSETTSETTCESTQPTLDRYDMFPHIEDCMNMTIREWLLFHNVMHRHYTRYRGRKVLKPPFDWIVLGDIIADTKPQVIIEIGSYEGGSALWMADYIANLRIDCPVISIDISDRAASVTHPGITWVKGDASTEETFARVKAIVGDRRGMVIEDSDHKEHITAKLLEMYCPLVAVGCYFLVEDTICEFTNTPPFPGPLGAVKRFVAAHDAFVTDRSREKYVLTYNPMGYLLRTK